MFTHATLNDLPAFCIGHATDTQNATGCSVIVAPQGAICGVDVRGGGPATRETDLLRPENMVDRIHAVVLSGGSAFGLEASCGVADELARRRIGFELMGCFVPIVVGACLFDLTVGNPAHPNKAMGAYACKRAFETPESALTQGNIGAGTGASVGKFAPAYQPMKSGLGCVVLRMDSLIVGALVAVNAIGCVRDKTGSWIAGPRNEEGQVLDPLSTLFQTPQDNNAKGEESLHEGTHNEQTPTTNTTIGCIMTNAMLTKAQATKVSCLAHDGLARAITPVHTKNDGDAIFCMASGDLPAEQDMVGILAAEATQCAIVEAVRTAKSAYGLAGLGDIG